MEADAGEDYGAGAEHARVLHTSARACESVNGHVRTADTSSQRTQGILVTLISKKWGHLKPSKEFSQ